MKKTDATAGRDAGFTLIEMMVVIVIIGMLAGIGLVAFGGIFAQGEEKQTEAWMADMRVALGAIETEIGSYPPGTWSAFKKWVARNKRHLGNIDIKRLDKATETCAGVEILRVLFEAYGQRPGIDEDYQKDLDEDGFHEYLDAWRIPVVYICNLSDDPPATTLALGEDMEDSYDMMTVEPLMSKIDKRKRKSDFQLISAGVDGIFGTEDDIVVFGRD